MSGPCCANVSIWCEIAPLSIARGSWGEPCDQFLAGVIGEPTAPIPGEPGDEMGGAVRRAVRLAVHQPEQVGGRDLVERANFIKTCAHGGWVGWHTLVAER